MDHVAAAIAQARTTGAELILCTGGMSVDPDDNAPGGIRQSGARVVAYGAPVLPGAMFLLGYYEDGTAVCGLPGCVMYAGATVFDLVLPKLAAGVEVTHQDLAAMGEGGLCLGCSLPLAQLRLRPLKILRRYAGATVTSVFVPLT